LLRRDSRFVLDNNLIIAAIKSGWKRSTDLLFTLLLSDASIFVNKELLFEYEKYINKILGMPHLFLLIQRRSILIDPSMDSLLICRRFFPESEFADAVHAATCFEARAILISNDAHFDKIRESELIEVWRISEAIAKVL
jgi:predicted nucleic acid-binding protein